MKVTAMLSLIPIGTGLSLSGYIAACERVLREAGRPGDGVSVIGIDRSRPGEDRVALLVFASMSAYGGQYRTLASQFLAKPSTGFHRRRRSKRYGQLRLKKKR